ncbi:D-alanine--D-alanine ligase family protein [Anaerovorax odorimutans]|uniref:D-alanine--D-alanine ligase family protein n=1 Tax=Anaerovorax odorimutans TaxID=109327 RepID=UPI000406FD8E|nr:D-alanine--D-alanine ligase family protein [Anaerovorax odorimutans]
MKKIGIIFGGRSGEHSISLMSAASVIRAINKDKFQIVKIGITKEGKWLLYDGDADHVEDGTWQEEAEKALKENPDKYNITILGAGGKSIKELIDFALPILHGPYGEDGTVQGLLEMADIPYGGCGITGSAIAMDKLIAREIFMRAGIPVCKHIAVFKEELDNDFQKTIEKIEENLPYPVFVKPANMGSSVGITKAKSNEELKHALKEAMKYDRRLIIEEYINCRELETAVVGNFYAEAAAVGEILPSAEFYDYEAKYFDGGKSKICIPADIPQKTADEIREIAVKAYKLIDCAGFSRVDFFLEKETNKIYLNEINTIPGFTKFSMFPLLWEEAGVSCPDIIERIVELGYERYHAKDNR